MVPSPGKNRIYYWVYWLMVNGEAIYGTRPRKVYGEGPTQVAGGSFSDNKDKPFVAGDIRFTTKENSLYAISLDQPQKTLSISSLGMDAGKIKSVELLGTTIKVNWTQNQAGLNIPPSSLLTPPAMLLCIK